MNIPEAEAATGLTKTIRYYEGIGLMAPDREPNGYRHLTPKDLGRLRFLSRARGPDFVLQDCRDLLTLNEAAGRSNADVRRIDPPHLAQGDDRLADLRGRGQPECSILDALAVVCTHPAKI